MQRAIALYVDDGRFSIAAKHQKDVAELYEQEMDLKAAMANYQTAADYYEGEGAKVYVRSLFSGALRMDCDEGSSPCAFSHLPVMPRRVY